MPARGPSANWHAKRPSRAMVSFPNYAVQEPFKGPQQRPLAVLTDETLPTKIPRPGGGFLEGAAGRVSSKRPRPGARQPAAAGAGRIPRRGRGRFNPAGRYWYSPQRRSA